VPILLVGVTSHQGARESRVQGEVAQVAGELGAVRYARCGTPKPHGLSVERCSEKATGELIDTETVTISSGRGRWKSTREGNSLAVYSTARPVRRGAGRKGGLADLARGLPYLVPRCGFRQRLMPSVRLQRAVSDATPARHHPRQEPGTVVPHAGICAGGAG
jgi:hypothetical protein